MKFFTKGAGKSLGPGKNGPKLRAESVADYMLLSKEARLKPFFLMPGIEKNVFMDAASEKPVIQYMSMFGLSHG